MSKGGGENAPCGTGRQWETSVRTFNLLYIQLHGGMFADMCTRLQVHIARPPRGCLKPIYTVFSSTHIPMMKSNA